MEKGQKKFTIKDWDINDRPREKMLRSSPSALSNAELLAILINSGTNKESALGLTKRLLSSVNNDLYKLNKLSFENLTKFRGIGPAKAVKIKAALALGQRLRNTTIEEKPIINCSSKFYDAIRYDLHGLPHEEFWVIFTNQRKNLIGKINLSKGGITSTVVDIRLALKRAIELEACFIGLAHNHPSGNSQPSHQDKLITQKFKAAAINFDIGVIDHLIVTDKGYFSFVDNSIL